MGGQLLNGDQMILWMQHGGIALPKVRLDPRHYILRVCAHILTDRMHPNLQRWRLIPVWSPYVNSSMIVKVPWCSMPSVMYRPLIPCKGRAQSLLLLVLAIVSLPRSATLGVARWASQRKTARRVSARSNRGWFKKIFTFYFRITCRHFLHWGEAVLHGTTHNVQLGLLSSDCWSPVLQFDHMFVLTPLPRSPSFKILYIHLYISLLSMNIN